MKSKRTAMKQMKSTRNAKIRILGCLSAICLIGFAGVYGYLQHSSSDPEPAQASVAGTPNLPTETRPQPAIPAVSKPIHPKATPATTAEKTNIPSVRKPTLRPPIRVPENPGKHPRTVKNGQETHRLIATPDPDKASAVTPAHAADNDRSPAANPRKQRQATSQPNRTDVAETTEHPRPDVQKASEQPGAALNPAQQSGADFPEGESVVDLLVEDYDGTLALIYESGESDWSEGNRLMREVTESVMEDASLEEQLEWVESLPEGVMKGSAAGRVIEQWGGENAITSLHWALSMEDQGARGSALSAAFGKWGAGAGGAHPEVGAKMIDNLEQERDRDFALNGYASGVVGTDPALALELAESISNPGLRDAAVSRLTRQISRMKPEKSK